MSGRLRSGINRLSPEDRWLYGSLLVAFVVVNLAIAVFGWTDYWRNLALFAGILFAGVVTFRVLRHLRTPER